MRGTREWSDRDLLLMQPAAGAQSAEETRKASMRVARLIEWPRIMVATCIRAGLNEPEQKATWL